MKTKLLGVVAACVLALTVGIANATTYTLVGTFAPGVDSSMCGIGTPCNTVWPSGTLTATLDIDATGLVVEALNVGVPFGIQVPGFNPIGPCCQQTWQPPHLQLTAGSIGTLWGTLDLVLNFADDTFTAKYFFGHDVDVTHGEFVAVTWNGTGTMTTLPLPATLPLFATGLGALGLLDWRRKRKARAAA